ncbi:hypothetical protein GUITHDRAFT_117723 [Guillardia theta CCMP2712]|uniref:Uncharacterized protein n=1 Tax=Guillardia theta (strain CCMP2712) TaxID=905079 RepID=L1IJU6_GUITC|nr:hypothetical protein GUITHDRAFT_117723 [Guillardia theta CCMP2712]EKX36199.1 hypothetical protein GUITHDRAFT_117723 [Guillardia theta CCMP2712]|eukprot:XP_005823179.1 hypothetical protein GUITHDRAFT_117723 [Guillardia theta CCMP2712]
MAPERELILHEQEERHEAPYGVEGDVPGAVHVPRPHPLGVDHEAEQHAGHGEVRVDATLHLHGEEYPVHGALYNMTVVSLEYINEYNVAVTVLQASMQSFDVLTRLPKPGYDGYQYVVYFVNPTTNEGPSTSMYSPLVPQSLLSEGLLCPNERRMPEIGASLAEAWAGVLLFMRLPLNAVVLFPAIFSAGDWPLFTQCATVTLGNSMLLNCGKGILNVDLAFEAWHRSSLLYYQSFVKIITFGQGLSPSSTVLLYAKQAVIGSTTAATYMVHGSPAFMSKLLASVDFNRPFADLSHAMLYALPPWIRIFGRMMRFSVTSFHMFMHFLERLIMDYVLKLAAGEKIDAGIFSILTGMRGDIEDLIVTPNEQICGGVSLIFGYTNPPATVMRYFCEVGAKVVLDLFDFLTVFFVDFPIVNCICKDSQGVVYSSYLEQSCYPWTPVSYRPLLNALLVESAGSRALMCSMVVNMTNSNISSAFDSTFMALYDGYTSVGSVFDYFLIFMDPSSGTCNNYYTSDYVMSIMPEPIDYFTMCYTTRLCEVACGEQYDAFNSALVAVSKGKDLVYTMNKTVTVESQFFTADGEYYGTNRLPFDIFSVVELSGCNRVCYGDIAQSGAPSQPDRCISAVGLDSSLSVVVKAYCLPSSLKTGFRPAATVTDGSFPHGIDYKVAGSSSWSGSIMRMQYVSINLVDSIGHSNIVVVATSKNVSLISDQQQSYTLLQTIPSSQKAVQLTDVYSIDEVQSFPDDGVADIFVQATTTTWDASGSPSTGPVCLHIALNTQTFANLVQLKSSAYTISKCSASNNVFSKVTTPYVTCLGHACSGVALFPTNDGYPVTVCDRKVASPTRRQISMTQDNVFIRQSPKLAQNSLTGWNGAGQQSSMTIFAVADQKVTTTWLSDIRLVVNAGVWNGTRSYSSSYQMLTTLKKNCSVSDCTGCMGYPTLQSLCYAASQCAVARCIGTEVNFQRPLCAMGSVVSKMLRQSLITMQNVYLIFAQSMALIVDASTGQITNRVVIEWPDQVFFSAMCDMKDVTISAVGMLMSLINGITMKAQQVLSSSQVALVPTDPTFNARATLSMASMTNLFSQILLLPIYGAVASQKTFVCTTNSLTAVLNTDLLGNFQLVIGDPSIQAVSGDVAGVCLTQVFNQDVQNMALGGASNTLGSAVAQVAEPTAS